jgi:hypothetical protein
VRSTRREMEDGGRGPRLLAHQVCHLANTRVRTHTSVSRGNDPGLGSFCSYTVYESDLMPIGRPAESNGAMNWRGEEEDNNGE